MSFLLTITFSQGSLGQEVSFSRVQALGLKSTYSMKNSVRATSAPEAPETEIVMNAVFETEVTSAKPDGSSTLATRFSAVELRLNGETQPSAASLLGDASESDGIAEAGHP